MNLTGTITALITPFKNGKVDLEGFKKNIDFQIQQGISAILPLGTTGESVTLLEEEQEAIIRCAVDAADKKVPVLVGTGCNSTHHTIENTRKAKNLGADAAVVVTPYYNKPTQDGIIKHYQAIAKEVDFPLIAYNIPGRTGTNMEVKTLLKMAEIPQLFGLKDCSGNFSQMSELLSSLSKYRPDFKVYAGDDGLALPLIALGAKGLISVMSNLIPNDIVALVDAALQGDFEKARKLHYKFSDLFKVTFIETNPLPIKQAMNFCQMPAGDCRLPLCSMQEENIQILKKTLESLELIKEEA